MAPTSAAVAALHPLGHRQVTLDARGWLGQWQERNRTATLPHVLDRVESGEAWTNLARLVGRSDAPLRGMVFTDSDVHKALEALAWAQGAPVGVGEALAARGQALVELLDAAQEGDGYLNSRVQGDPATRRWADPQWGHELYCAGHLLQAAVAAARTGTLPGLLPVAVRFADLLVARFGSDDGVAGPGGGDHVDGHPEVETALVELYRLTGHRPYLQLASRQLELRGHRWLGQDRFGSDYFQDAVPVRGAREATGHAVRQLYLLTGAVDVAVETGDEELLAAVVRVWDDLETTKTYLTGAHGSRHRDESIGDPYELPADRAYAESCAAIASFQLSWRLLLATGQARFAESMETVLHNGLAASTSVSGREFFYSNPLHLRTGHGGEHEDAPSTRLPWFACACCPPSIARLLASAHDYLITTSADGIALHHPSAASAQLEVDGAAVGLRVDTDYPWDGRVRVVVSCAPAAAATAEWELALRVPAWCTRWSASVDGQPLTQGADDGYLRLRRSWDGEHEVVLDLELDVRLVAPHPRIDAVRGCVAVARGPLVHALEATDLPAGVVLEDVRLREVLGAVRPEDPAQRALAPVWVEARVDVLAADGSPLYREQLADEPADAPAEPARQGLVVRLLPYHRWAGREEGAMRVWIPV